MIKKKFQAGGVVDEDELFADDTIPSVGDTAGTPPSGGNLDGELAGGEPGDQTPPADGNQPPADEGGAGTADPAKPAKPALDVNLGGDAGEPGEPGEPRTGEGEPGGTPAGKGDEGGDLDIDPNVSLTGVEEFLTQYGIQGGLIKYEDGTEARFTDLEATEQAEILSSLVKDSVPSVEEKYNLDNSEIDLLNTIRESGRTTEDFINDVVDHRLQAVLAQQNAASTNYEDMSADALFVKNLKDANPELSDDALATELAKAKELTTFDTVINGIRKGYISEQAQLNAQATAKQNEEFEQELENQRTQIVQAAEGLTDVAGAELNDDVKEFLLHDVMEVNENKDPILMEKIFSNPETMIKVNWFLNYGEDYINNVNNYWKKQVSLAAKSGFEKATRGMPGSPTQGAGASQTTKTTPSQGAADADIPPNMTGFGKVVSEEELFG